MHCPSDLTNGQSNYTVLQNEYYQTYYENNNTFRYHGFFTCTFCMPYKHLFKLFRHVALCMNKSNQ